MFRATMWPSSGETTVFMRHLVLVILCGWMSGMQEHMLLHTRHSPTQNNKYQMSHKHSRFSWWWAHSRPKHVETDKYTKNKTTENKLCTKLALFTRPLPVSMPDCGRKFDTYQSQKELFCLAPRSSTRSLEDTKQKSLDISIFHYNTPIQ